METTKHRWTIVAAICAMLMAGSSIATNVWRGGEMASTMKSVVKCTENIQTRIEMLEQHGTYGLKAHIELANERNVAVERRLKLNEDAIAGLNVMQADVREIKVRIQMMEQFLRGDTTKTTTTKGTGW